MNTATIKISTLTGKLAGFQAINTNTLSNDFCSKMQKTDAVCSKCYSAAMLRGIRKNCVKPWQHNSDILSGSVLPLDSLPVINAHSFRYHAHGELINYKHLVNLVNIAVVNPHTTFALWTKRKDIVARYVSRYCIPDNLVMIFSNASTSRVLNKVPVNFDKVFNASESGTVKPGQTECTAKSCIDCMACYRKDNGHQIIVEKLK